MRLRLHHTKSSTAAKTQLFIFISLSPVQKCRRLNENAATVFCSRYSVKDRIVEGHTVVDFVKKKKKSMKMAVVKTYFKKRE